MFTLFREISCQEGLTELTFILSPIAMLYPLE